MGPTSVEIKAEINLRLGGVGSPWRISVNGLGTLNLYVGDLYVGRLIGLIWD
jgi:hypothetical protein